MREVAMSGGRRGAWFARRACLVACLLCGLVATVGVADDLMDTVTRVYFERGKKPLHREVDFTVRCFGYPVRPGDPSFTKPPAPGSYKPVEVFSFSAKCPDYGCKIHQSFHLNYLHIDWCNLEGRVEGRAFLVERYAALPVDFNKCKPPGKGSDEYVCELRVPIP